MKKHIIKINIFLFTVLFLPSCFPTNEPVLYEKYTFSNENANLYLINLTDHDISAFLEKNDGNTVSRIISTTKMSEDESNNLRTRYLSKERFISFICRTIENEDNNTLYTSKVVIPKDDLTVTLAHNTGGFSLREIEKNFADGDFLFTSRPGDYLFVDCDIILKETPDDYYGAIKNPRYIIIISE